MSEPENFLERWSRRKRETEGDAPPAVKDGQQETSSPLKPGEGESPVAADTADPPFDISTLPSVDSIGAHSDVRAFMQPGVPLALRHAALRRAWSADPDIRDFIGLVENGWDFNDPHGVPGFGPLPEGEDIAKLLAQAIGAPPADQATPAATAEPSADLQHKPEQNQATPTEPEDKAPLADADSAPVPAAAGEESLPHNRNYFATQQEAAESRSRSQSRRRGHGGALPE